MQPIVMQCKVDVEISFDGDLSDFNHVRLLLPAIDSYEHVSGPKPANSTMLRIADWSHEDFEFESLTGRQTEFTVYAVDRETGERFADVVHTDTPKNAEAKAATIREGVDYVVSAVLFEGAVVG